MEQETASTRGAWQAQRKPNKRKQLRKLVSHSCVSQPKSKAGGACKGHWKNSSDVICPHRARLAQRKKKKKVVYKLGKPAQWLEHASAGVSCWPVSVCHFGRNTKPLHALLWSQSPLHRLVALGGETLLKDTWSHFAQCMQETTSPRVHVQGACTQATCMLSRLPQS